MAPENTETMQKGNGVSNGCFQGKNLYYVPPGPRCNNGYKLGLNHAGGGKQADADSEAVNSDKLMVSGVCYGRPLQHENCYFWSPYSYPYDGSYYSSNNGLYYPTHGYSQVPMQMLPQSYPPEYSLQDFQYFVVIDFEATCDKEKNPHPQEIIEFPSVLVNSRTGQLEDSFQIYVRPTYNKQLTEFCKELTGINQSQVDEGVLLSEALLMHDKWLEDKGIKHANFTVVTWSNWDCRVMLESECRFKKIRKPPYFNRWINLKVPFGEVYGGSRCNLREAVELSGLKWEGRAHCGLDDAKNTARLLTHLMYCGIKLSITNSLLWQSADHPHALQQPVPSLPEYGFPYQTHKWENLAYCTAMPFAKNVKDPPVRCYCGATSIKFLKPGPKRGSLCFFGCGNWTANGGARCPFAKWVPASDSTEAA